MTKLNRIMLGGDPAADLLPTPDSAQTQRIQTILDSDDQAPRFEGAPTTRQRKRWWLIILAVLAAVTLITVYAINDQRRGNLVLGPDSQRTAAAILRAAADKQTELEASPGQWWELYMEGTELAARDFSTETVQAWVISKEMRQYHPVGDNTVYCGWQSRFEVVETIGDIKYGPGDDVYAACNAQFVDPDIPEEILAEMNANPHDHFEDVPRDPNGLREYLDSHASPGMYWGVELPRGESIFRSVVNTLTSWSPQPPADLRAALLRYLADDPSIIVTDDSVQLGDRTVVALGYESATYMPFTEHLLIDPATGQVVGQARDLDGGKVDYAMQYAWSVLDELPSEFVELACLRAEENPGSTSVCPTDR